MRDKTQDVLDQCLTREGMVFIPNEAGATLSISGQVEVPFSLGELVEMVNMGLFYTSLTNLYQELDEVDLLEKQGATMHEEVIGLRAAISRTLMQLQAALDEIADAVEGDLDEE